MTSRAERPIHLDTSFLIRALIPASVESNALRGWLQAGRPVSMCALAWGEFLCGPLEAPVLPFAERVVRSIVPVACEEAVEAARLFNQTGRRRGSFQDCLVAAAALTAGAALATSDRSDFGRFADSGLELLTP